MHKVLESICVALDETANKVRAVSSDTRTLKEMYNWQFPALTFEDLAALASRLATRIRDAEVEELESSLEARLSDVPRRLQLLWAETIPNLAGNPQAFPAYMSSLDVLEKAVAPLIALTEIANPRLLPAKIAARLRTVNRTMDLIEKDNESLSVRVGHINNAYLAAQNLPATVQDLEEARIALEEARAKVGKIFEDVKKTKGEIESNYSLSSFDLDAIQKAATEAKKLVEQCEAAFQITTTKGLAGAFDQRAVRLNISIVFWVFGLLAALAAGANLGSSRIDVLSKLLSEAHPDWGVVVLHIALSVLSVGGPVWFAWLATKQIGQRFRLAEDYAFKASVAKAYEGYRKQAANLDEEFSARLFGAALTRLEEAPLRLVEKDTHGSPWHELVNSEGFRKAVATVPEFHQKVVDLAGKGLDTLKAYAPSRAKDKEESAADKPN